MIANAHPPNLETLPHLNQPWEDLTFVGFDTEATGKYPLTGEMCEVAAVKWRAGKVIDEFSTLIKPVTPMTPENTAIHGITNDMVENAPRMSEKIGEFREFIGDATLIAHHAPFDLGFLSLEMEKAGLDLPWQPVLCSSLLARKLFPESENHRLQTLIGFFQLQRGQAHRATDDAKACLEVGLKCLEKIGARSILAKACEEQGGPLTWQRFSMRALEAEPKFKDLMTATQQQKIIEMVYASGSNPGEPRRVHPMGIVRSLDGDFLVAYAEADQRSKRYFLDKVTSVKVL